MMLCVWLLLLIVLPLVGCQEGKRTAVMLADAEVLMYSSSDFYPCGIGEQNLNA